MDTRTGPKIRINYVVRIFRSGFVWSGPWSGFSGLDFPGPVRGPDFSVRIFRLGGSGIVADDLINTVLIIHVFLKSFYSH